MPNKLTTSNAAKVNQINATHYRLLLAFIIFLPIILLGCGGAPKKKASLPSLSIEEVEERQIDALRGIKKMGLQFHALGFEGIESNLKRDVELELRKVGVTILSMNDTKIEDGSPLLVMGIHQMFSQTILTEKCREVVFTINGNLELRQSVALERDPSLNVRAITWQTTNQKITVEKPDIEAMQSVKKKLLDEFLNAYLKANPKNPD